MVLTNPWKCVNTLDIFAPHKKKILAGKQKYAIHSKKLVNAHRKRTHLRNKSLKNRTETNRVCYNKHQNFCVSLLRKTKKYY